MTKLQPPAYPPLPRQARVQGDVEVTLSIRQDGSVESAAVIRGHPLLAPAAVESARQSQFQCQECTASGASQVLVYSFEIQRGNAPTCNETSVESRQPPLVSYSGNHVKVTAPPVSMCVGGGGPPPKARSARCLYLWKCRSQGHRMVD